MFPSACASANREERVDTVAQGSKRFRWVSHPYCLMDNHYHLVVDYSRGLIYNLRGSRAREPNDRLARYLTFLLSQST